MNKSASLTSLILSFRSNLTTVGSNLFLYALNGLLHGRTILHHLRTTEAALCRSSLVQSRLLITFSFFFDASASWAACGSFTLFYASTSTACCSLPVSLLLGGLEEVEGFCSSLASESSNYQSSYCLFSFCSRMNLSYCSLNRVGVHAKAIWSMTWSP